jgi:Na+/proline symporter
MYPEISAQMEFDLTQKQPLFAENCLFFAALLLSFVLQFDLLLRCIKSRLNDRLSANLLINMFFWILTCFAGLFNIGYLLVRAPEEGNGKFLFVWGRNRDSL